MSFRKIVGILHLYLGFTSGVIIFVIAITGCLYVFKNEIENLTQPHRFVEPSDTPHLLPSQLFEIAQSVLPDKTIHSVIYQGNDHAARVVFYDDYPLEYYYFVYINPYSGEVLNISDENNTFFSFILDGHFYLWLPHSIGQTIVATSTLIFIFILITGIILWWPKNKHNVKQKFKIKWNARWRRRNYDLHSVIGFYISWLALIFSITGLVWGFQWFMKSYYTVISGGNQFVEYSAPVSSFESHQNSMANLDNIWTILSSDNEPNTSIEIHAPEDSLSCIAVSINPDIETYWKTDYRYFDSSTLEEKSVDHMWGRYQELTGSEKLMRMNYDIHVGAIGGIIGKIIAFVLSLIIATIPVSGFLLWWGRKNKKAL